MEVRGGAFDTFRGDYNNQRQRPSNTGQSFIDRLDNGAGRLFDTFLQTKHEPQNDSDVISDQGPTISDIEEENRRNRQKRERERIEMNKIAKAIKEKKNEFEMFLMQTGLKMKNDPDKGRCIYANQTFEPGTVIYYEYMYNSILRDNVCWSCWYPKDVSELKRCGSCKTALYCTGKCQKNDWKSHKPICKSITSLKLFKKRLSPGQMTKILLVGDMLYKYSKELQKKPKNAQLFIQERQKKKMKQYKKTKTVDMDIQNYLIPLMCDNIGKTVVDSDDENKDDSKDSDDDKDQGFEGYDSSGDEDAWRADTKRKEQLITENMANDNKEDIDDEIDDNPYRKISNKKMLDYIKRYLKELIYNSMKKKERETVKKDDINIGYSDDKIMTYMARFDMNCMDMLFDDFSKFGTQILPFTSVINHSCDPNVFIHLNTKDKRIELRVITKLIKNEELIVNYLLNDTVKPTVFRQRLLKKRYKFKCECLFCKPVTDDRVKLENLTLYPICRECYKPDRNNPDIMPHKIDSNKGVCMNLKCLKEYAIQDIHKTINYAHQSLNECKKYITRIASIPDMKYKSKPTSYGTVETQTDFALQELMKYTSDIHYLRIEFLKIKGQFAALKGEDDERIKIQEQIYRFYEIYFGKYSPWLAKESVTLGSLISNKANQYKLKLKDNIDNKKPLNMKIFALATKYFKRAFNLRQSGINVLETCLGKFSPYVEINQKQMEDDIDNGKAMTQLKHHNIGITRNGHGDPMLGPANNQ